MARRRHERFDCNPGCPVEATLSLIGGKWKGVVLWQLLDEKLRFNELKRRMPNVTQRVLSNQLRELEAGGFVIRTVQPGSPPSVEYELSPRGASLESILFALRSWGEEHVDLTGA